jgi:hypothetical protein
VAVLMAPHDGSVKRHRRLLLVVGLVLVAGGVAFVIAWKGGGARQASLDDAKKRFAGSDSTLAPQAKVLRPAAGVYVYTGSGAEHLSSPPKSQTQGPKMPATVTHRADGCWTLRIDYSTNHWQSSVYCPRGTGLYETGGQTFERFNFVFAKVDTTSTIKCTPENPTVLPGMTPEQRWDQRCTGTSTGIKGELITSGPYTFVGEETVDVGGTPVAAYRFHQDRTLRGAQTGTQVAELWFAKSNGMPLRNEHRYLIHSDSPIGQVTFTEKASWRLSSLTPQR